MNKLKNAALALKAEQEYLIKNLQTEIQASKSSETYIPDGEIYIRNSDGNFTVITEIQIQAAGEGGDSSPKKENKKEGGKIYKVEFKDAWGNTRTMYKQGSHFVSMPKGPDGKAKDVSELNAADLAAINTKLLVKGAEPVSVEDLKVADGQDVETKTTDEEGNETTSIRKGEKSKKVVNVDNDNPLDESKTFKSLEGMTDAELLKEFEKPPAENWAQGIDNKIAKWEKDLSNKMNGDAKDEKAQMVASMLHGGRKTGREALKGAKVAMGAAKNSYNSVISYAQEKSFSDAMEDGSKIVGNAFNSMKDTIGQIMKDAYTNVSEFSKDLVATLGDQEFRKSFGTALGGFMAMGQIEEEASKNTSPETGEKVKKTLRQKVTGLSNTLTSALGAKRDHDKAVANEVATLFSDRMKDARSERKGKEGAEASMDKQTKEYTDAIDALAEDAQGGDQKAINKAMKAAEVYTQLSNSYQDMQKSLQGKAPKERAKIYQDWMNKHGSEFSSSFNIMYNAAATPPVEKAGANPIDQAIGIGQAIGIPTPSK